MNLVLTLEIGLNYTYLTHPTIKAYAERIDADFKVETESTINPKWPYWERYKIYDYLERYDRIIYVDADTIIRNDCPDLTTIVPASQFAIIDEVPIAPWDIKQWAYQWMLEQFKFYDIQCWPNTFRFGMPYYNTGVMVVSRAHKEVFKVPEKKIDSYISEQNYINLQLMRKNISIFRLPIKFNHFRVSNIQDQGWHDSYIIHYTTGPGSPKNLDNIKTDIEVWKSRGLL